MKYLKFCATLLAALSLSLCGGCKKKPKPEAETPAAESAPAAPAPAGAPEAAPAAREREKLPGESAVRAALKKKDYAAAVSGLAALRGVARLPGGAWEEYRQLNADVGAALAKAAATDPNAAQATMTFQLLQSGR
jgi:pyruvate/2-oxoglutarate dehydrogenase complex dihydrolipoamide acyltransferase (E2) component